MFDTTINHQIPRSHTAMIITSKTNSVFKDVFYNAYGNIEWNKQLIAIGCGD